MKHIHAELIKQWADGAEIQYFSEIYDGWMDCCDNKPSWSPVLQYRIKPEPCNIETYDIQVGDIWLVGKNYLFVSDMYQSKAMLDGWCIQFCCQKGKYMQSTKSHLNDIKAQLMFRRNGTVNRLNEI